MPKTELLFPPRSRFMVQRILPILALLLAATPAVAQHPTAPDALDGNFAAAIVVDADTGEILLEKDSHARRQPASMLKMMTELIVLERVADGDVDYQTAVTVSAKASKMGGSQVYLKHGETFTVEELLQALAIHSANDASAALAEHIAGSCAAFVDLMNMRARELGMQETEFHSVHGLPPGYQQKHDLTSAYDMALLARELIRHPQALQWSATATAPFRDGEFTLYNPNKLVGRYRGLDGLKTGFHAAAGYCITATAVQKGKRLISVIMGAPTEEARATETTRLLSYGFSLYTQVTLVEQAGQPLDTRLDVEGGKAGDVALAYRDPLVVSVPKHRVPEVVLKKQLPEHQRAPLVAGQAVGMGFALLDGKVLGKVPIVTREGVEKGSWLDRLLH